LQGGQVTGIVSLGDLAIPGPPAAMLAAITEITCVTAAA
jgi:hypothetical protein